MKMLLVLMLSFTVSHAAAQDYRIYHTCINNAERCFFLDQKTDSAFHYYDQAFAGFDFVFAHDCFMAAQIAYYCHNDKYIDYLRKGFKNGLRPRHLKQSVVFAPLIKDSVAFKKQFAGYPQLRAAYLKRINAKTLKKVIQHVSEEQSQKNRIGRQFDYEKQLDAHLLFVESLINTSGFPGDKVIGIGQADIMHELGYDSSDYIDLYDLTYKDPKYNVSRGQFVVEEECLAQERVMPMMVHHPCIWKKFSVYWSRLIISGQIHPRDVAFLFDNQFRWKDNKNAEIYNCPLSRPDGLYQVNIFIDYTKLPRNRRTTDSMRTALFINRFDVDSAKSAFHYAHGFQTSFRFEYLSPAFDHIKH